MADRRVSPGRQRPLYSAMLSSSAASPAPSSSGGGGGGGSWTPAAVTATAPHLSAAAAAAGSSVSPQRQQHYSAGGSVAHITPTTPFFATRYAGIGPAGGDASSSPLPAALPQLPEQRDGSQPRPASRALAVAMARAAAHREAAASSSQRRVEAATPAPEGDGSIALAQAAIGRELAGLHEEVQKARRRAEGETDALAAAAAAAATATASSPQRAASVSPSKTVVVVVGQDGQQPSEAVEAIEAAAASAAAEAEEARRRLLQRDEEIVRLKQVELEHAKQGAELRDLRLRASACEGEARGEAERAGEEADRAARLQATLLASLETRLKQTQALHKLAKAQLVKGGWKSGTAMPSAAEFFRDAEAAVAAAAAETAAAGQQQALVRALDCLGDYENYVHQTLQTAKRMVDEKLSAVDSAASGAEARVGVAEHRARAAEEEAERIRQQKETHAERTRAELEAELAALRQSCEDRVRSKEEEVLRVQSQVTASKETTTRAAEEAAKRASRVHAEQVERLERRVKELERVGEHAEARCKQVEETVRLKMEREKAGAMEELAHSKEALIENLELAKERAEEKARALQEELDFQERQRGSESELERHRAVEEVNKAKQEAQEQLRALERQSKKAKLRADELLASQHKAFEQEKELLVKKNQAQELDLLQARSLLDEAQARCEELQLGMAQRSEELDHEQERRAQQLKEAEGRIAEIAALQSTTAGRATSQTAQLMQAEARIQSLGGELAAMRIQKSSSNDALTDSRRHAAEVSDQLADALKRILELETRIGESDLTVQHAGGRAAMLDGCLAEATASLAASEEEIRIMRESKHEHERAAAFAVAEANELRAQHEEVEEMLREKEKTESELNAQLCELQDQLRTHEGNATQATQRVAELEQEVAGLRGEIDDITRVTLKHKDDAVEYRSNAERISSLANILEERELQNHGMKKRIEELEAARMGDEGRARLAEMRVEEVKKALYAAKLRQPELERALEVQKRTEENLRKQLKETRQRADARSAEAQTAVMRAAMLEGRHKEALARQQVLQKQVAEAVARSTQRDDSTEQHEQKAEEAEGKVTELSMQLAAVREALREESTRTSRLEGQLSEMASEQVHLQEALRYATTAKEELNQRLLDLRAESGALESRLMASYELEHEHAARLAASDGARDQALSSRTEVMKMRVEMEDRVHSLEEALAQASQEKGELNGALVVADAEIRELKASTERLMDHNASLTARHTMELEGRDERATDEVKRLEELWQRALQDQQRMRMQLEEVSVQKGALMGELDAVRTGTTSLTANAHNATQERDRALEEISRLSSRLMQVQTEIESIEGRASQAVATRGELEGIMAQLRTDLASSQKASRHAQEALVDARQQAAVEKSTLESHVNVLAAGLQDLEYQLQVAAQRTSSMEEEVIHSEEDALRAVEMASPLAARTPAETVSPPSAAAGHRVDPSAASGSP